MSVRIDELLKGAIERLTFVSDSAKLDAQLLLADVLSVATSYFFTWPEKQVNDEQIERFEILMQRRLQGEPIAYILGQQSFWSLDLEVMPCTLIPRADTERLVEVALSVISDKSEIRILDLGTGTGAIALALASEKPCSHVLGVDFISDAVELAKNNARRNNLLNVEFFQSDWFSALDMTQPFDLIVSNPPYIDPEDIHLSQGDVRFEPKTALISDSKGLSDIEHIITQASSYLISQGYLIFEHGYDQASKVQHLFREAGFVQVETFQDLTGNDRVTIGQRK